jgi:hypothetical protein
VVFLLLLLLMLHDRRNQEVLCLRLPGLFFPGSNVTNSLFALVGELLVVVVDFFFFVLFLLSPSPPLSLLLVEA